MSPSQPTAGAGDAKMTLTRVRNPGEELLRELQEYDLEAFGATGLRTYDLAVMAQAGAVLVARIDADIVGGCQLMRVLDEPDFFYVVGFYIRPRWRGRASRPGTSAAGGGAKPGSGGEGAGVDGRAQQLHGLGVVQDRGVRGRQVRSSFLRG